MLIDSVITSKFALCTELIFSVGFVNPSVQIIHRVNGGFSVACAGGVELLDTKMLYFSYIQRLVSCDYRILVHVNSHYTCSNCVFDRTVYFNLIDIEYFSRFLDGLSVDYI